MVNVSVVFIDNRPKITMNHIEALSELVNQLHCEDLTKQDNELSFIIGKCKIRVTNETIEFSRNPKDGSIPEENKKELIAISNRYKDEKTLFVIDLCLNKLQNDGSTGVLAKDILINEQTKRKHDFLFVSAVLSLRDDSNTLIRAVTPRERLDNSVLARTICKFYPVNEEEENLWEEKYSGVLKLMRSRYLNTQLLGAILFRAIKMADNLG